MQHNKSQDSENKLTILAIKSKCTKNNLCPVIDDIVCVLVLETLFLPTIYFLVMSPFAHIHSRFHALQLHIHNAIPDYSLKNLVWQYTDKTDILKCFHSEFVKSFIQFNQKVMHFYNVCEYTFHEQKKNLN